MAMAREAKVVSFDTSLGPVSFELYVNEAPRTVHMNLVHPSPPGLSQL